MFNHPFLSNLNSTHKKKKKDGIKKKKIADKDKTYS